MSMDKDDYGPEVNCACGHSVTLHQLYTGRCTVMPWYPTTRDTCSCEKFVRKGDKPDSVNHPPHYRGADNPYEAIKVIEAWNLGFNLGNTVKYICRADQKGSALDDLKKAAWYLNREIENREKQK